MKQETAVVTEVEPETASSNNFQPAPERKRNRALSEDKRFKIFAGSANRQLAEEICKQIGVPLGETKIQRFADGEIYFQLLENVRGVDVFVVQPTCNPVDSNLVELLIMIDALKRASAGRITTVVPYYGYARQDRKDRPRVAISSKLVADLLTTAGTNRALFFATKMGAPLAIVDKRRTDINVTEVMNVIGDVEGRTCLIIDDIVDTAGTLVKTAHALLDEGAVEVYACASHPVLSGPAVERIASSRIKELVVTNSIPLCEEAKAVDKIKVLSIAGLLGAAIESIHMETSVSSLFN